MKRKRTKKKPNPITVDYLEEHTHHTDIPVEQYSTPFDFDKVFQDMDGSTNTNIDNIDITQFKIIIDYVLRFAASPSNSKPYKYHPEHRVYCYRVLAAFFLLTAMNKRTSGNTLFSLCKSFNLDYYYLYWQMRSFKKYINTHKL